MNWIVWGILGMLGLTFINIGLLLPSKPVKTDIHLTLLFIRLSIILAAILAIISFFIPGLTINDKIINKAKKYLKPRNVAFLAISLLVGLIILQVGFIKGGSIASVLFNLNLVFLILYGIIFLKEKTDIKIWIGIAIYILSGCYITYQKTLLNK